MKLTAKTIITEVIGNKSGMKIELLNVLINHFNYSIKDIDELKLEI